MIKELTCIGCPMGCQVKVELDNDTIINISGYTCKRGYTYAQNEVTHPTRMVTSSVILKGNPLMKVLPVKTESDIPKDKIMECTRALKGIEVNSPIHIGDIIVEDVANTGVNIIATKEG